MKQITLLTALLLLALIQTTEAQSLTPSVVASSGGFSNSANGSLSYTTGEMTMVKTFTNGSNTLTQGFQQPDSVVVIGLLDPAKPEGNVALYPVPASTQLWFAYQFEKPGRVEVTLFDMRGAQIDFTYSTQSSGAKEAQALNCEALAAGTYLLRVAFTAEGDNRPGVITKQFQVIH